MESSYILENLVKDLEYKMQDAKERQLTGNEKMKVAYWSREELCKEILGFIHLLKNDHAG